MTGQPQESAVLGIVGTGAMGRGVAQIAVQAGITVWLYDARAGAADEARESVTGVLNRLVEKGKLTADAAAAAVGRMRIASTLPHLAPCNVVLEAIVENLSAKRELFQALESIVSDDCILATNTSSLSVTSLAAQCQTPGRVAGFHFFNPVPLMKVVEVIEALLTERWVVARLHELAERMGHVAVVGKDTPGFIVNHAGRGYLTEALRILGEGCAEVHDVDRIMRDMVGFRLGPFELLDLTGLDVSHPVMESIYNQYYQEPRYRPSPITAQRLSAGLLGRKTGRGFYTYVDDKQVAVPMPEPLVDRPTRVWVSRRHPRYHVAVSELVASLGATLDDGVVPAADALCVVTPVGQDATTCALDESLDPTRTVAIDVLFGLARRRTLMGTPLTSASMRRAAQGLFGADGTPVSSIDDCPGFVAQRIIAQIVNIGSDIAQQKIASPKDIDSAVRLGLAYPKGPLALGDDIGPVTVLAILENLFAFYGDPRYRPSPWLKRRARLGVSLLTSHDR